jgi:hypothetical protein
MLSTDIGLDDPTEEEEQNPPKRQKMDEYQASYYKIEMSEAEINSAKFELNEAVENGEGDKEMFKNFRKLQRNLFDGMSVPEQLEDFPFLNSVRLFLSCFYYLLMIYICPVLVWFPLVQFPLVRIFRLISKIRTTGIAM